MSIEVARAFSHSPIWVLGQKKFDSSLIPLLSKVVVISQVYQALESFVLQ